ncbi:MAG: hypothetical protein KJ893_03375 [Candidatus Omnitrophica bacterium]|nr:hypothetical protein [Candidatus Omnitrophota bacterium]MBU4478514.1 hypothetical protein [Candidatus Omnitrophota bacterium]MCG2703695.1 hypothetical protein [Candidatus Omnitrophota bacterium]
MIEINLLPESYKVSKKTREQALPITFILLVSNGIFLLILLLVTAFNVSRVVTLHAVETRLDGLAPEQQRIIAIQQRIINLKNTNALFRPQVENRYFWAKALNYISDLTIPGIWLRTFTFEKIVISEINPGVPGEFSRRLKIGATAVSLAHDEMAIIGDFLRNLKTDKDFCRNFKLIELESVLRRKISTVEVMDFTLVCRFNEDINL